MSAASDSPTDILRNLAQNIHALYHRIENEFKSKKKIIIYGSYLMHEEGIELLTYLKNELKKRRYKNVYLVKDFSDKELKVPRISDEPLRNFIRSVKSFDLADILIFVFPFVPLSFHLSGVLVELTYYVALREMKGWSTYALVLIDERLNRMRKITSLLYGMIRYHDLENRVFADKKEALSNILSFIQYVISEEIQRIPFR